MRMIDADKLMEFAKNHINHSIDCNDIARFPTVDAEPVRHGRWVQVDEDTWMCSVCGVLWTFIADGPEENGALRCPVCGAKLDGGDDDG